MSSLSERDINALKDAIDLYDTMGDGKVDSSALADILRAIGENPTESEVQKFLVQLDPSGNKRITHEDLIPIALSCKQKSRKVKPQEFVECLRVFDKDCSGNISCAEHRQVLTTLGDKLTIEDVDMLTSGLEQKGQVNYEEFVRSVMSG
ncbi:myosin-2 essential light chain-like [Xenia sp. Carnegie-2017]|uniref:myosin-2 essential light chain-like n=1 Tax=Xenia sp. Carnegie-2017 TaxID=2897299 RepID=UPI001F040F28|nr:myosin-2 essential light chain-like [Xenia sp. Carnegie-2017]XP_046862825.1 myosin-2 essential light chain-like [Xenia sp. Carnegie-2017]XP_046864558.1 myosin-2 essential light chain-like [Xenia sp. Carnegie-2017]